MTHEEAFIQAIAESPEDDAHRLVYADWLEDHDQSERAEFIRVQCELARLDVEEDDRREELQGRESDLLAVHRVAWLGPLNEWASDAVFARGFVERATIGARRFLTHVADVFRLVPLQYLKVLRLGQTKDGIPSLAECPLLARLRGLDLAGSGTGYRGLPTLLASEHLGNLTTLNLSGASLSVECCAALMASHLTQLEHLDLSVNYLGSGLRRFTGHTPPFRLQTLNLSETGLDVDDVRDLARWPGLASLRALRLDSNSLRVTASQFLAESPRLARLERLSLRNNRVGAAGMRALAATENLPSLRALDVSEGSIGIQAVQALTDSTALEHLEELRLNNNFIGTEGAERLAAWPGLASLRTLSLAWTGLGERGLSALLRSPHLRSLRELNLRANDVRAPGIQELAKCPHLANLRRLRLSDNPAVGGEGIPALLHSSHLPRLRYLHLDGIYRLPRRCLGQLRGRFVVDA